MKVLIGGLLLLTGCASTVAKILPIGEPVTVERCKALDMKKIGYEDAVAGNRNGDKYEFWLKDCASLGARPDRAIYDAGYSDGLAVYCSCEIGFQAGVKEEYTELKKQYMMCTKKEFTRFQEGHKLGLPHAKDEKLVKKTGPFNFSYDETEIEKLAKTSCSEHH